MTQSKHQNSNKIGQQGAVSDTPNSPSEVSDELKLLETLARSNSTDAKDKLFEKVSEIRTNQESHLSDNEGGIVDDILISLASQVETTLRVNLAEQLTGMPEVSDRLISFLIHDKFEVAAPLLSQCLSISDEDLVDVVKTESDNHRLVVASRDEISEQVTDSLIDAGDDLVLVTMVNNDGAAISREGMGKLAKHSEKREALRRPILERRDLPADVANAMFWWVSSELRKEILERFPIDEDVLDAALTRAQEMGATDVKKDEMLHRVSSFLGSSAVTVNDLISYVRSGDMRSFGRGLMSRLKIEPQMVEKILKDQKGEALAISCRALDSDRGQFITLFLLLDYRRFGKARPTGHVEYASRVFELVSPEAANRTLNLWNLQQLDKAA